MIRFLVLSALLFLLTGCHSNVEENATIVRVGDSILTKEQLRQRMAWEGLKPDQESDYVERWVNRELLYLEARRLKLDRSQELKWELELVEKEWMIHRLLEQVYVEKIQITEDEVVSYYDANKDQFLVEEDEVKAFHLLAKDRNDANLARQEILAGRSFEEVARQRSIGMFREKGGDMGYIRREDLIPEISRVLFSLSEGAISAVIQTGYGFHLVKAAKKRRKGDMKEINDVRDEIIQRLRVSKEHSVYYDLLFQLQNKTKVEVRAKETEGALLDSIHTDQHE